MDPTLRLVIFHVATTILPLILCIAVHEWAHVAMARWLGDDTGTQMGRFTLNPLAHVDPIWTVVVPTYFVVVQSLGGNMLAAPFFAAGKPAPYRPNRLDRRIFGKRIHMRTGEMLVAAAGPVSNLILAIVCGVVVAIAVRSGSDLSEPRSAAQLGMRLLLMNTGLFLFNLIPVPPLDGSKVLMSVLPRDAARRYEEVSDRLSWGLFVVVLFGARFILAPIQTGIAHAVFTVLF